MKKLLLFLVLLLVLVPLVEARTTSTHTYYMQNSTITVNGITGYELNETQTTSMVQVVESAAGNVNSSVGFRVWRVESNNASSELTDGIPVVERTSAGSGIQSATWTPDRTELVVGWDSLKVNLYMRLAGGAWTAKATFTTERLLEKTLLNDTWTFNIYTQLVQNGTSYNIAKWGSSSYNSRVEGVGFADAYGPEGMMVELGNQDFIGFILYPMTSVMGNTVPFGVILLGACGSLYIRYHSFKPILILFILFGGASGVFTLLIPEIGMAIGWVFMLLGLGGLLWQLKR